jgi:hypothetical protein
VNRDQVEGVIPMGSLMAFLMMVLAVIAGLWIAAKIGVTA